MEIETDILMNLENDFKGISKIIIELIKKYNENLNTINNNLIVSHRDIDQKNVLWDNVGNPMVIDWESS
jgi:thiamine kinase-like enzyme